MHGKTEHKAGILQQYSCTANCAAGIFDCVTLQRSASGLSHVRACAVNKIVRSSQVRRLFAIFLSLIFVVRKTHAAVPVIRVNTDNGRSPAVIFSRVYTFHGRVNGVCSGT